MHQRTRFWTALLIITFIISVYSTSFPASKTEVPFSVTATFSLLPVTKESFRNLVSSTPRPIQSPVTSFFIKNTSHTPVSLQPTPSPYPALENTPVPKSNLQIKPDNAKNISEVAQWGKGAINAAIFSANGKIVAIGTSLGVYFYDISSQRETSVIFTDVPVRAIAYAPDSKSIAIGLADGKIEIRATDDYRVTQVLSDCQIEVLALDFSTSGSRIASVHSDNHGENSMLCFWKLSDPNVRYRKSYSYIGYASFSIKGELLIMSDSYIDQWDIDTFQMVKQVNTPALDMFNLSTSADGKILITSSADTINFWHYPEERLLYSLQNADIHPVFPVKPSTCNYFIDFAWVTMFDDAVFTPDDKFSVLAMVDDTIQVRRVSDGALYYRLNLKADKLVMSPDGRHFLRITDDGILDIHNVMDGSIFRHITGYTSSYTSLSFSPDNSYLAVGATDHRIRVWSVRSGSRAIDINSDADIVQYSPVGNFLISGLSDGNIQLWNLANSESSYADFKHLSSVISLSNSGNGQKIASSSADCTVQLWQFSNGLLRHKIELGGNHSSSMNITTSLSPDGKLLAVGGDSMDYLEIYQTSDGVLIDKVPVWIGGYQFNFAFSPNGDTLATISANGIRLWEVKAQSILYNYTFSSDGNKLAFSPDGQILAIGSRDGNIDLMEVQGGKLLTSIKIARGEINSIAFSPNGYYLASGSTDGVIRLYAVMQ